jgi:hypothetical protein
MKRSILTTLLILVILVAIPTAALADEIPWYDFVTPLFGLAVAPDGSLLVADSGAGIVELRNGTGSLIMELPGVVDIAPLGRGVMLALTGGGDTDTAGKLYKVARGRKFELANLKAFEAKVNPDGGEVDSNPFDVAALKSRKAVALVADAGGNDLLIVDQRGRVDWVATLPAQLVSTDHLKSMVGCPTDIPDLAFICDLPDMMPAEAVATSVAIGPDGAYYVGELTGFPGPVGMSRVWRIEPGKLHAQCGTSPACSVVADGFTSIVDLAFGPNGKLYVVEFDEAGFLAAELAFYGLPGLTQGGTVNVCDLSTGSCTEKATGLTLPIAVAIDSKGTVYAAIASLIPGAAQVITLP